MHHGEILFLFWTTHTHTRGHKAQNMSQNGTINFPLFQRPMLLSSRNIYKATPLFYFPTKEVYNNRWQICRRTKDHTLSEVLPNYFNFKLVEKSAIWKGLLHDHFCVYVYICVCVREVTYGFSINNTKFCVLNYANILRRELLYFV